MAQSKWICKNVDVCNKAFNNDGKSFEELTGHEVESQFQPYKCEECGKDLLEVKPPGPKIDGKKIVAIAGILAVVGGAGFGVWKFITRPPVDEVVFSVAPEAPTVLVGETVMLKIEPEDAAKKKDWTWSSKDESLAAVNRNGLVTGIGKGNATIIATAGKGKKAVTATASVTVEEPISDPCPVSTHAAAPEMVFVEGGSGVSGFCIGKYEITQAQWETVMGGNPSGFTGDNRRPVDNVSWNDAQEFINKLNALTGNQYRLPTEAEWEYAARGGAQSRGYAYSGSNNAGDVAWFGTSTTQPVGSKQPNELGIYDMSGNVWEWCSDQRGSDRALRGGGWNRTAVLTYKGGNFPDRRYNYNGFRVAHSPVDANKSAF